MHHHDHTDNHHNNDHHHAHDHHHEHGHDHGHTHDNDGAHHHGTEGHENLLGSKEEAAAFLQYTLNHNAHHVEELSGLVHSLEHLALTKEAAEIRLCIEDITRANKRLEAVLAALK